MAASDAVPVIIGAAIGAGGAVIAQVTSAVFTARREAARLKWEKERQGREWKLREAERFMSIKQELYSRYISILYRPITDTMALTRSEYATQPDWPKLVPKYVGSLQEEIDNLRWNIRLLGSPVVAERVEFSNAALLVATSTAGRPDEHTIEERHEFADQALRAWQQVRDAMRADLRGDEEALQLMALEVYGNKARMPLDVHGNRGRVPDELLKMPDELLPKQRWWRSFIHRGVRRPRA